MKYRVYALYTASKFMGEVEADTIEEAETLSENLDYFVSLCHHCSDEIELGDAYKIEIESTSPLSEPEEG